MQNEGMQLNFVLLKLFLSFISILFHSLLLNEGIREYREMSVPSYLFYFFSLKLLNKGMNFSFSPLKLPNKRRKKYYKIIIFIVFYFIPFSPLKRELKVSFFCTKTSLYNNKPPIQTLNCIIISASLSLVKVVFPLSLFLFSLRL